MSSSLKNPLPSAEFDSSLFEKNLRAFQKAEPGAARHLWDLARPRGLAETFVARSGATGIVVADRKLNSPYDPIKEAAGEIRRVADRNGGKLPRTLCLLGSPGGYLVRAAFEAGCRDIHVYEPDPEVLALTLGICDYSREFEEKALRLAKRIEHVFFNVYYGLRMIPDLDLAVSPLYRKAYPEALVAYQERIRVLIRNMDLISQTIIVKQDAWFDHAITNFQTFAGVPGIDESFEKFAGVPIVVVSAGPSLDKNVALLKEHRDKVMICSVGTALRKLDDLGIVPDLAVALESNDILSQFKDLSFIRDIFLALDIETFPDLWRLPCRGKFGFSGSSKATKWFVEQLGREGSKISVGGSVATATFSIAALMGADPIILIGQDLAFSSEGALHAGGIGLLGEEDLERGLVEGEIDAEKLAEAGLFPIEGYNGEQVLTKANLLNYLLWFEQSVPALTAAGRRAVNSTEGGAKIAGFEQIPLREVLQSLKPLGFNVKERLEQVSVVRPISAPAILKKMESFIRTSKRIRFISKNLRKTMREAIAGGGRRGMKDPKIARAMKLAEKGDREIMPLLKKVDALLAPLCNAAILLTEKVYDYEGLSDDQQIRMNLQQTYTIHDGLAQGADRLIAALEGLCRKIHEDGFR